MRQLVLQSLNQYALISLELPTDSEISNRLEAILTKLAIAA